jgi:hypothetical protein
MPFLIRPVDLEDADVGRRHVHRLQASHQRLRDGLADAFVVERDVEVGLRRRDRTVVGDDLHALRLGLLDQRGRGGRIDGIDDDRLRPLRDHRVELLLLPRGVAVRVLVEHLAGGAQLLHLGDEAGVIVLLVAGRCLVGHQEGDLGVGHGRGEGRVAGHGEQRQGGDAGQREGVCSHVMSPILVGAHFSKGAVGVSVVQLALMSRRRPPWRCRAAGASPDGRRHTARGIVRTARHIARARRGVARRVPRAVPSRAAPDPR